MEVAVAPPTLSAKTQYAFDAPLVLGTPVDVVTEFSAAWNETLEFEVLDDVRLTSTVCLEGPLVVSSRKW